MAKNKSIVSRRRLFRDAAAITAFLPIGVDAAQCTQTLETEPGPFLPARPVRQLNDLLAANDPGATPAMEKLYVFGRVVDAECYPLGGTDVLLWQADHEGRYDHPDAQNNSPLDSRFAYFGRAQTSADGFYYFRTIVPAPYVAFGLRRAAHIHFRFSHARHEPLTTELYFEGPTHDLRRKGDAVWLSRPKETRNSLIIPFSDPRDHSELGSDFDRDARCCRFDIALNKEA